MSMVVNGAALEILEHSLSHIEREIQNIEKSIEDYETNIETWRESIVGLELRKASIISSLNILRPVVADGA